jgi:hypothetical protein
MFSMSMTCMIYLRHNWPNWTVILRSHSTQSFYNVAGGMANSVSLRELTEFLPGVFGETY